MSKHEVTIGMTQEIKELMYVEGYASESTRIAEFIAAKGERFRGVTWNTGAKDMYFAWGRCIN